MTSSLCSRAVNSLATFSKSANVVSSRGYKLKSSNIPLAKYGGRHTVTMLPGDGIGPEIAVAVQKIFAAAEAPIAWDPVDVTPVKNPDGTMGIPQAVIDSVNKNKIGLKSPLMTPVGKGFRSV